MGGATGLTRGQLDNNRPVSGAHNCTSWICTAPIGEGGSDIISMVRGERSYNIHTNPGWWQSFISVSAPRARVPFHVRWTDQSLEEISETVKPGERMPWDFNEH